ncbi:hypothetical protein MLD38_003617 [Melastoma candidum]|uniref:Uncharacterized protein n=1 Tax=Melastoma candidum TaxID=119954 RepID=A0ACB9S3E7_9MYRT|nr:hypothetical protein MLD38_003617 [Melastoma candidum]
MGNGITRANGFLWAPQRKIVAPEFFADKVKVSPLLGHFSSLWYYRALVLQGMVGPMVKSAETLPCSWETRIDAGVDVNEFNPQRFVNGIMKACEYPQAYVPFGHGPRTCLGQQFATAELKIYLLSLIVSGYTFSLSPRYRHSPAVRMLVVPEHGVHIILRKI